MLVLEWIKYYLRAKTIYRIHSPKLFDFISSTLENDKEYYVFGDVEQLREQLLNNHQIMKVKDLGAGSKKSNSDLRKISSIVKSACSSASKIELLFLISLWTGAKKVLELGTSFGLSTIALSAPDTYSKVITIEGDPEIAKVAQNLFKQLQINNITSLVGAFENCIDKALEDLVQVDLAFIDGNHSYSATLYHFIKLLPFKHKNSLFIFDDIYWSKEMKEAWEEIKAHQDVCFTIDLYFWGLVFFDPIMAEKKHFRIIEKRYKPFQIGLWS